MTFLNVATIAGLVLVVLVVCAVAFVAVCGTSEKTADYEPCDHTWPDTQTGHLHRCTRIPGGHRRHRCKCGVLDEPEPLLIVDEDTVELDEPVTRIYVEPGWTMFRGGLVHTACLGPLLMDEVRPCAGCAVHLDHVLTGAT